MKRYIRANSRYTLQQISSQSSWEYQPFSKDAIIYKNPIPYAGDDIVSKVLDAYYGFRYECIAEDMEIVDLDTLQSIQAFVTEDGLNSAAYESKDVYAIRLNDQLYLMNGNHRVASAYLQGERKYPMIVRTLVEV